MRAHALFEAGKLDEAIAALGAELRSDPTDIRRRTFLFELLCFTGDFDRAEKHLEVVARGSKEADMGAWLYRSALHADRVRQGMFSDGVPVREEERAISGTANGTPFQSIEDADPRVGARLEMFAAGQYTWIPFDQIAAVRTQPPKQLRDLLWIPAKVVTAPTYSGNELGEVLLPVLSPLSWKSTDDEVRLGRVTDWEDGPDGPVPVGQKLLLIDGEPLPILELRELEITPVTA